MKSKELVYEDYIVAIRLYEISLIKKQPIAWVIGRLKSIYSDDNAAKCLFNYIVGEKKLIDNAKDWTILHAPQETS